MKELCHFKISGKCVLHKYNPCFLCSHKIYKIDGITEMKDYVNIVSSKQAANKAYRIAILSLLISVCLLIIKIIEMIISNKNAL